MKSIILMNMKICLKAKIKNLKTNVIDLTLEPKKGGIGLITQVEQGSTNP